MTTTGLEVTLHQGRERAEVTQFTQTLEEIVRALREIDHVYLQRATRATWVMASLTNESDNLIARLEVRRTPAKRELSDFIVPVEALVNGARTLQAVPSVPRLFSPTTVSRMGDLASPRNGVQTVSLAAYNGSVGEAVALTDSVRENAKAALDPYQISYGSITGRVIGMKELSRTKKVRLTVRAEPTQTIVFADAPERLVELVRTSWRHRMLLGGKVRRNASGQAIRMDVDALERMPEDDSGRPSTEILLGVGQSWFPDASVDDAIDRMRRE